MKGDQTKMRNNSVYSKDEERNREKAEAVLDKMNNLIRGKSFTKMAVDARFERLQEELINLG